MREIIDKLLNWIISLPDFRIRSFLFQTLGYTYLYKEYSMGNRLLEKYQDVIKSIKESTGIKIVSVEEVEDNQAFLAVKEVI